MREGDGDLRRRAARLRVTGEPGPRRRGWSCCWGLNPGPLPYQGSALPLSYSSTARDSASESAPARTRGPSAVVEDVGAARVLERAMGIEPTLSAWKAEVLPLNYARLELRAERHQQRCAGFDSRADSHLIRVAERQLEAAHRSNSGGTGRLVSQGLWWGEADSNRRRCYHQIYSLAHLAALESPPVLDARSKRRCSNREPSGASSRRATALGADADAEDSRPTTARPTGAFRSRVIREVSRFHGAARHY